MVTQELSRELAWASTGDLEYLTGRLRRYNNRENDERWLYFKNEALRLWKDYAENYRTAIYEYRFLVAERRKARVCPINSINERVLKEYPYVELFYCLDEFSALEYLDQMSTSELAIEVRKVTDVIEINPSYRTITSRIKDFRHWQKFRNNSSYCPGLGVSEKRCCCSDTRINTMFKHYDK